MKPFRRTLVITVMATVASMRVAAQVSAPPLPRAVPNLPLAPLQRADRDVERVRRLEQRGRDDYQQGSRALDNREYERAISSFQRVIEAKSPREDGAYYWKAYALNKLARRDEALAALAEIFKQFPQSRWNSDAKALEAEVRQASGQGVAPENQDDEEVKLLAINSLTNSDPERAVPLLEKLLNDAKNSPRLKERALFVLAQSRSDKAHGLVGQYAKGGSNPDLQLLAIEYLGTFRSKDSQQLLSDVYAQSGNLNLKRAVLRGFMVSRDAEHLLNAAKNESNPELRRDAIQLLGTLRAQNELAQLYASESNYDVKAGILQAMFIGGGSDRLVEIAKNDKDSRLRAVAIKHLGTTRRDGSEDALVAIYSSESDKTLKREIINALFIKGAAKQLVDVARAEKDPELKKSSVQKLAMMKSKEATDYLMELLNK